jgi:hypothetical protein
LTTELADEQQRNAGHLAEIADLQKGYEEKLTAFEVRHRGSFKDVRGG